MLKILLYVPLWVIHRIEALADAVTDSPEVRAASVTAFAIVAPVIRLSMPL